MIPPADRLALRSDCSHLGRSAGQYSDGSRDGTEGNRQHPAVVLDSWVLPQDLRRARHPLHLKSGGRATASRWSWLGVSVLSGAVSACSNPAMPRSYRSVTSMVSDSGSETGAASSAHTRSDAVSLTVHSALTSTYIPHQVRYSNVCVVRDEETAGSNPATPTGKRQVTGHLVAWRSHFAGKTSHTTLLRSRRRSRPSARPTLHSTLSRARVAVNRGRDAHRQHQPAAAHRRWQCLWLSGISVVTGRA